MDLKKFILDKKADILSTINLINKKENRLDDTQDNSLETKLKNLSKEFENSTKLDKKRELLKRIVFLNMEIFVLSTSNKYTDCAMSMIEAQSEESWFFAINYLNSIDRRLAPTQVHEVHIFKAMLYELIENFNQANIEYKKANEILDISNSKLLYRAFIERVNQLPLVHKCLNIQDSIKDEAITDVIDRLYSISKYYAKSKKSLNLAKKYHKEALNLYSKLAQKKPKEYARVYMNSLNEFYSLAS